MPRAAGVYQLPPGTTVSANTTIQSAWANAFSADVQSTFNTAWPVSLGGTGGISPVSGLDALTVRSASIAAAATVDLSLATGRLVHITGTGAITSFGTAAAGVERDLVFDSTPTITYNATSMIIPGSANRTVVAGDSAIVVSEGSGNWRFLDYQRADGSALISSADRNNSPGNMTIVADANVSAANALTIRIKGFDGNDPSASNPVYIPFRSATAASGDIDVLTLTAATSLVVSSGSTLGTTSAVAATLTVVAFNDATTLRLGIINQTTSAAVGSIASSTAEGGAGAADSSGVFYTGTAVTSKAYTVLGYLVATEATAGTWATAPSLVTTGALETAVKTLPFTKSFTSAQQTIVYSGALTIAHGLGVTPRLSPTLQLHCTVASGNYSVGDEPFIAIGAQTTSAAVAASIACYADATNVYIRFPSRIDYGDKTTGALFNIVVTNWTLVVSAWA